MATLNLKRQASLPALAATAATPADRSATSRSGVFVAADAPQGADTPTLARQLILADRASPTGQFRFASARRLFAWALSTTQRQRARPTGLRIDDLQGRQFFTLDQLRAVTDVPLPAGTYHVSVHHGEQQRLYTVTLVPGARGHLRTASARHGRPGLAPGRLLSRWRRAVMTRDKFE